MSKLKVLAWNVNGIRAVHKKANLNEFLTEENPDVAFFIECKLPCPGKLYDKMIDNFSNVCEEWKYRYYNPSRLRKGYAGTVLWSKIKPKKVVFGLPGLKEKKNVRTKEDAEFLCNDPEGRVINLIFEDLIIVGVYTPNSGQKLVRHEWRTNVWDVGFQEYITEINKKYKNVMIVGDLNVAHKEIDIFNPKRNTKSSGFTVEERTTFENLLENNKMIDTWRIRNKEVKDVYTYWTYLRSSRSKNKGWRIDYILANEELNKKIEDVYILTEQLGSDHAPVVCNVVIEK